MKLQLFLLIFLCFSTIQAVDDLESANLLKPLNVEDISVVALAKEIVEYSDAEELQIIDAECLRDLRAISGLNQTWIFNLIDSAGKIPHGLLRMNLNSIGQYQQCIDTVIREDPVKISGQHCMLRIMLTDNITWADNQTIRYNKIYRRDFQNLLADFGIQKHVDERLEGGVDIMRREIALGIGICIPSSCSANDMNAVIKTIKEESFNNTIANLPVDFMIHEPTCTTEKKVQLSSGDIATISLLAFIGLIMVISTLYDLWYQTIMKGDIKDQNQLMVAFSVYSNTNRLFTPSKNPGPLAALHGIRAISLLWVVLGHRYEVHALGPLENLADVSHWFSEVSSAIITGGTVAVDSFFLMSGVLLSYSFFRSAKIKNTLRDLPLFYIHRILRLTPSMAVMVLIYATLLRHYGNGPYQYLVRSTLSEECVKNWWPTLLYVQNYVGGPTCVLQTWYLAVDMQLYVVSPLLLYPLLMHKRVGIIWVSFCIFVAQATAFVIAYLNKWPAGTFRAPEPIYDSYQSNFYYPTHTRATPYFIGILAGYFLIQSIQENKIKTVQYNFLNANAIVKAFVIVGWHISLAIMGLVPFGYFDFYQHDYDPTSHWADTLYIAFSRTAWCLGLLWIIVACAYGYGGPINWFLSLPVWEIVGRFSYAVYLTHMGMQICFVLTANHMRLFSHLNLVIDFCGDVMLSFALSYALIMSFESPIGIIEKILFKKGKGNKAPAEVTITPLKDNINHMDSNNNVAYPDSNQLKEEEACKSR